MDGGIRASELVFSCGFHTFLLFQGVRQKGGQVDLLHFYWKSLWFRGDGAFWLGTGCKMNKTAILVSFPCIIFPKEFIFPASFSIRGVVKNQSRGH